MSQAQSFANHSMYMASIVLTAWDSAMKASAAAAPAIDAAFAPAVRLHLLDAYGWQLLACNRMTGLPLKPPHCVATMPLLAEGIEVAPEVKEFQLLEAGGWLAELQKEIAPGLAPTAPAHVLAVERTSFNYAAATDCFRELEYLMDRVSGVIDES